MRTLILLPILAFLPVHAVADMSAFTPGPVIKNYGQVVDVDVTVDVPKDVVLHHSFDVSTPAEDGQLNRALTSVARFINMHARAGIDEDRIHVAIVFHGKAIRDVSGAAPASADLVATLIDHGVKIYVCGQTAAYYDVARDDLLPGVDMALSAMTMHALLQQQGYTLNPF